MSALFVGHALAWPAERSAPALLSRDVVVLLSRDREGAVFHEYATETRVLTEVTL